MVSLFVMVFLVTLIWFFIARRKDKKASGKTTRQTWYLLFVSIVAFIIVGALSPKPEKKNADNLKMRSSSSSSDTDSESKKASSEAERQSILDAEKASSEAAEKASSESAARSSSEEAARESSLAESRAVDSSNAAAEAARADAAQQNQTPVTSVVPSDDNNTNNSSGRRWAIQDGYNWETRKHHSTVVFPGGTLPAGYHWEVGH